MEFLLWFWDHFDSNIYVYFAQKFINGIKKRMNNPYK